MYKVLCLCLVGLLQAACSTMSPEQCKVADWGVVGLRDGQVGAPLGLLDTRSKDCAKVGVQVLAQPYLQGREVGLQSYCQLGNAAREGLAGHDYAHVCPLPMDAEFQRRWQVGLNVFGARQNLSLLERRRRNLEWRLRDATSDDERFRIRNELFELDMRFRFARDTLRDALDALNALNQLK